MNSVFSSELVIESRDTQYLAFILNSPELFFQTGYKVLQNQEEKGFIKCTKVTHNGKIKLVYDIQKYQTLESLLPSLRPDTFITILANLVEVIVEVKNNGFMQSDNIAITLDKTFIDCNNYKVHLIYLPLDQLIKQDDYSCRIEDCFREIILSAIKTYPGLADPTVSELYNSISNTALTVEAMKGLLSSSQLRYRSIDHQQTEPKESADKVEKDEPDVDKKSLTKKRGLFFGMFKSRAESNSKTKSKPKPKPKPKPATDSDSTTAVSFHAETEGGATEILSELFLPSILLLGIKTPKKVELEIDKPEFVIGKKPDAVDGAITFNSAISRVHCKILYKDNGYYIVDLGSANGTFVNGRRVPANQQVSIKVGDKVRLANSDFIVKSI